MRPKVANAGNLEQVESNNLRPGFDTAMFLEVSHIVQHPLFLTCPTLTRLLTWLLHETLAGHGDSVKSYTIAVEALGRAENFDSQSDSYPRVQMSRLRKSLETYYAQQDPLDELCVYLQSGSYRLRLAKLHLAYPQLYRPLSGERSIPSFAATHSNVEPDIVAASTHNSGITELPTSVFMLILASLVLLAILVIILVV